MDILDWIQDWYQSQCDGDWEHDYGVKVATLDNPGWTIEIDLEGTVLEDLQIEYKLVEGTETYVDVFGAIQSADWYGFSIKDKQYNACGDPTKLRFLLEEFRRLAQEHSTR